MNTIPCYVMEEHNEALIAWHHTIRKAATGGFSLVHVDEHSDLCPPRCHSALPSAEASTNDVARYVFDQITNYEFIVPLANEGTIGQIFWVHREEDSKFRAYLVGTAAEANLTYFAKPLEKTDMLLAQLQQQRTNCRLVDFSQCTAQSDIRPSLPVLLDIDLDYFSCLNQANDVRSIELSEAEARAYYSDRYHYLRVELGGRIRVREVNGRHFLFMREYAEPTSSPLIVTGQQLWDRIDRLIAFLTRNGIRPAVITICRSAISGYADPLQVNSIESRLLDRLRSIYALALLQVKDIYTWP